jgi:methylated-DNA-[protein]-cysteine S-methyltransferase
MTTTQRRLPYALFDTALGRCGIAWSDQGVVRIQFPDASDAQAIRRLAMGAEITAVEPPAPVRRAIDALCRHLDGDLQDFGDLALDMREVADFHRRVYVGARKIPAGRTVSYGELASRIGSPGAARAVGQALGKNPLPIVVPCHRVLAAGGKAGGFSAYGGLGTKRRILAVEGVLLGEGAPGRKPPVH